MTARDVYDWVKQAPVERATLPAAGVVWTASEILHAVSFSGFDIGAATAAAAGLTYGAITRRGKETSPRHARQAATGIATVGGWLTAATQLGPGAGPYHALSIAYGVGALAGYRWLRNHEMVKAAREWRTARADWHGRASRYGLNQSHLLDYQRTWLGEEMLVDITETNRKASSYVAGHDLAETIAQAEMLAETRVQVSKGNIAGRIRIQIRYADPWQKPLPHPVLEAVDGFDMPVPCTVRQPITVGYSPDNGHPLKLTLWDEERGAKSILVVGMRGAGKSALLSCIRERVTAAGDAILWDINASKAREDHAWADACDLSAIGYAERERALRILLNARYAIDWRSAQPRKTADFAPDGKHPLIVIVIDEIDELLKGGDNLAAALRKELAYVASKARSEGVCLIVAGQRGTVDWLGGADVRTQLDIFCMGMVNKRSEMNNVLGDAAPLVPDMATYGEGKPGVWAIVNPGAAPLVGRSFKLTDSDDLMALAAERADSPVALERGLVAHLGGHYSELKRGPSLAHAAAGPVAHEGQSAGGAGGDGPPEGPGRTAIAVLDRGEPGELGDTSLENLDRDMTAALPPELRDQLARMDARDADTRRLAAEDADIERSLPHVDPAKIAEAAQERWRQGAEETGPLPESIKEQILSMIGPDGASGRKIAEAFKPDIKDWKVRTWLNRLEYEQLIHSDGSGRGAKWRLGPGPDAAPHSDDHGGDDDQNA